MTDKPRYTVKQTLQCKDVIDVSYWYGTKHWGDERWAKTWASARAAENAYFRRFGRSTGTASVMGRKFEVVPTEVNMREQL